MDEFDDAGLPAAGPGPGAGRPAYRPDPLPRLITRVYAASEAALRARLLQRLLDPLGTLGMAAVAAGAFAVFLQRRGIGGIRVSLEDAGRFSSEQVAELARFVAQVSPEALQAVAGTIVDNPVGVTALSASAIALLLRALRRRAAAGGAAALTTPEPPSASVGRRP